MEQSYHKEKIWGTSKTRLSLWYVQYLKLRYCLKDLKGAHGRVLDVGCGGGSLTKALKFYRPDLEVFGGDVSQKVIDTAKRDIEDSHPELACPPKLQRRWNSGSSGTGASRFRNKFGMTSKRMNRPARNVIFSVCDAGKLPFENESFDAVTAFDVLEHIEKPERILTEARRVLKKGGILHLSSPLEGQPGTLYWVLGKFGWRKKIELAGHLHQFSNHSLSKLVEKSGFKITRKRYSFHFLGQILDVLFYIFLAKKLTHGLEGELKRQRGIKGTVLGLGKNILVGLSNVESLVLQKMVGGCVHLGSQKSKIKS